MASAAAAAEANAAAVVEAAAAAAAASAAAASSAEAAVRATAAFSAGYPEPVSTHGAVGASASNVNTSSTALAEPASARSFMPARGGR